MFSLLTQALLWLLFLTILWYVLQQLLPRNYFVALGFMTLLTALILPFFYPADPLSGSAWSILSLPLKPLGLSLLLLLSGTRDFWVLGGPRTKEGKPGPKIVKSNLILTALLILLLTSNPWIARKLEQQVILAGVTPAEVCNRSAAAQAAGTIVVLGRGVTEAYQPYGTQIPKADTNERILAAVEEYRKQVTLGVRPIVIVSAGKLSVGISNTSETEYIRDMLAQMSVPEVTEYRSVNVHDTAVNIKRILNERQANAGGQIVAIASAIDAGRADLTFQRQGLRSIPSAIDLETLICSRTEPRLTLADFIPSVEALMRSTRAVNEFFTLIYYFMRGWLSIS